MCQLKEMSDLVWDFIIVYATALILLRMHFEQNLLFLWYLLTCNSLEISSIFNIFTIIDRYKLFIQYVIFLTVFNAWASC